MLVRKVLATIEHHCMMERGERVLVALSGGIDSVCLLHILDRLTQGLGISLCVAHFDHGLRPADTAAEARFVTETASAMGIDLKLGSAGTRDDREQGGSTEDISRRLRYGFLENAANEMGATKIAVGHTADDQAETMIMRFLRGAGLKGLCGIPPVGSGNVVRPLIRVHREAIEDYARKHGLSHMEDPSNLDRRYLRNRVRLDLLPALQREYNPNLSRNLAMKADLFAEEDAYLDSVAEKTMHSLVRSTGRSEIVLEIEPLSRHPFWLRTRILRAALRRVIGDLSDISFAHISSVDRTMRPGKGHKVVTLPTDLSVWMDGDALHFGYYGPPSQTEYHYSLKVPGAVFVPECGLRVSSRIVDRVCGDFKGDGPDKVFLDLDCLEAPLEVRSRLRGDRFQPIGMRGTKKVKKFLIDAKVPLRERDKHPIITSRGEIVWVVGLRLDGRFCVTPDTRRIVVIETMQVSGD